MAVNLFMLGVGFPAVGSLVVLGLAFLFFALSQGFSDFRARHSFSHAVPYFSSLDGHLRASAGWSCFLSLSPKQFKHLMSCGHWPLLAVSIESPISIARQHFVQFKLHGVREGVVSFVVKAAAKTTSLFLLALVCGMV
jgi:hypothetical protein